MIMKLMQIKAEISEDDYNRIINKSYRSNNPDYSAAEYAIAHGDIIPNTFATNGDVISTTFPKREVIEHDTYIEVAWGEGMDEFDKDWWNAPYERS